MREDNLKLSLAEIISLLEDMEKFALVLHRQRLRDGLPIDPKVAPLVEAMVAEEQAGYHAPKSPPSPRS